MDGQGLPGLKPFAMDGSFNRSESVSRGTAAWPSERPARMAGQGDPTL